MTPKLTFEIIYAPIVREHLRAIDPKIYSMIRSEAENQLSFEPDVETKNRKPLKRSISIGAEWELRFGPGNSFRIFYKIREEIHQIHILAIGEKKGNRLFIGGKEII